MQYNRWHIVPRTDLKAHTECAVDGYVMCTGAPAVRGMDGVSWTGSMPLIPLRNLCGIGLDHHIQHFHAADSYSFTHVAHRKRTIKFRMERGIEKERCSAGKRHFQKYFNYFEKHSLKHPEKVFAALPAWPGCSLGSFREFWGIVQLVRLENKLVNQLHQARKPIRLAWPSRELI